MQHIPLDKEIVCFCEHLNISPRVVFSAKFGDGKTTFLKKMKEHEVMKDYHFFTLHPINYSVSKNEDVFEYIKRDILLQLAKEGLLDNFELDAAVNTIYNWQTLYEALTFILQFIPKGGAIVKLIDKAKSLCDKYKQEENTWKVYEETFKSQRGGIYEEDGYTMLIRHGIDIIHREDKKTCLIIEDLDRIDPGHLFRILNVIGAHVDDENVYNKFGFTNIVAVMDYGITKHIFHHFYGEEANYDGYMSKFTSNYVYYYSITQLARQHLYEEMYRMTRLRIDKIEEFVINLNIGKPVSIKNVVQELSVRDITKILDDIECQINRAALPIDGGQLKTDAPILYLLSIIKRMPVSVSNSIILISIIESEAAIGLLGNFLCVNDGVLAGVAIPYNNSHYIIGNYENGKMNFVPVENTYPDTPDSQKFISNAFDKATLCIKDWNN